VQQQLKPIEPFDFENEKKKVKKHLRETRKSKKVLTGFALFSSNV
jgi:hypothetical protein